eukprot:153176-Rhodomonas_salina.6
MGEKDEEKGGERRYLSLENRRKGAFARRTVPDSRMRARQYLHSPLQALAFALVQSQNKIALAEA